MIEAHSEQARSHRAAYLVAAVLGRRSSCRLLVLLREVPSHRPEWVECPAWPGHAEAWQPFGQYWENHSGKPMLAGILMEVGLHGLLLPVSATRENAVQSRPNQCGQISMNWNHGDWKFLEIIQNFSS